MQVHCVISIFQHKDLSGSGWSWVKVGGLNLRFSAGPSTFDGLFTVVTVHFRSFGPSTFIRLQYKTNIMWNYKNHPRSYWIKAQNYFFTYVSLYKSCENKSCANYKMTGQKMTAKCKLFMKINMLNMLVPSNG